MCGPVSRVVLPCTLFLGANATRHVSFTILALTVRLVASNSSLETGHMMVSEDFELDGRERSAPLLDVLLAQFQAD